MPRFNHIKDPSSDPKLEALYKAAVEVGFVGDEEGVPNNFITSQSERPDILEAVMGLAGASCCRGCCHLRLSR